MQCRPGAKCKKRYAAVSLDKGHVSKLKCAMMEQLGKLDDWDCVEKHGNPVASPIVRDYLTFRARGTSARRGGSEASTQSGGAIS